MNMWAALCVYFLASYTAKLAVYMIGRTTYVSLSGINDPKILSGEVVLGTVRDSYAHQQLVNFYDFEDWSSESNSRHSAKTLKVFPSIKEALSSLQSGDIDGIVYQRGVMEHVVSSNFNCRLFIVGNPFGHVQYSIMFKKDDLEWGTWFDTYLGFYHSNMQIDGMLDKWRKGAQCDSQQLIEPQLNVNHCLGVFLMLLIGVLLGLVGCAVEHAVAKLIRKHKHNQRLLKLVRPISQRMYRSLQSDNFEMLGLGSITSSFRQFWSPKKKKKTNRPPTARGDVTANTSCVSMSSQSKGCKTIVISNINNCCINTSDRSINVQSKSVAT